MILALSVVVWDIVDIAVTVLFLF